MDQRSLPLPAPLDSRTSKPLRRQARALHTRCRILQAAMDRFWTQGYGATRVSQILSDAGANSGSLYNEFGSKEGLMLAVLDRFSELMEPLVFGPAARKSPDPVERISQLFQGFKKQLEETDFRFGSPIGNLAGELSHTHPPFRERLAELFQEWRRSVQQLLEGSDPSIPAHVDVELVSSYVLSVLQGCVGQARVMRDVGPIEEAERLLVEQLPTLLGHTT